MNIIDIAFYLLVLVISLWLLWELIPDGLKAYWKYVIDQRRTKEKYSFTFRVGGRR